MENGLEITFRELVINADKRKLTLEQFCKEQEDKEHNWSCCCVIIPDGDYRCPECHENI